MSSEEAIEYEEAFDYEEPIGDDEPVPAWHHQRFPSTRSSQAISLLYLLFVPFQSDLRSRCRPSPPVR